MKSWATTTAEGAVLAVVAVLLTKGAISGYPMISAITGLHSREAYPLVAGASALLLCAALAMTFPAGESVRPLFMRGRGLNASVMLATLMAVSAAHLLTIGFVVSLGWFEWPLALPSLRRIFIFIPLIGAASFAEELIFRGWLLVRLSAFITRSLVLVGLNGLLFGLSHAWTQGLTATAVIAVLGAAFAYSTLKHGGWERAWGAHWAHNAWLQIVYLPSINQPKSGYNGFVLVELLMIPITCLLLVLWGRRPSEARASGS